MTLKEQFELTSKAVDNNALKSLFLGQSNYEWGNLKHIPANTVTDIGAIIDNGIYKLYETGRTDITTILVETIHDLLRAKEPVATWTAYFILRYQYRNEIKQSSPFYIISPQLCQSVRENVLNQKDQLATCKEYVGRNLPNGLWDDIQRLENVMRSNYGVSIL